MLKEAELKQKEKRKRCVFLFLFQARVYVLPDAASDKKQWCSSSPDPSFALLAYANCTITRLVRSSALVLLKNDAWAFPAMGRARGLQSVCARGAELAQHARGDPFREIFQRVGSINFMHSAGCSSQSRDCVCLQRGARLWR